MDEQVKALLSDQSDWPLETLNHPNAGAYGLFDMIQRAYLPNWTGKHAPFDKELVQYLAACGCVSLQYNGKGERIPWDKLEHDCILTRLARRFALVLQEAIQKGEVVKEEGKILVGCLSIPKKFIEYVEENPLPWIK